MDVKGFNFFITNNNVNMLWIHEWINFRNGPEQPNEEAGMVYIGLVFKI